MFDFLAQLVEQLSERRPLLISGARIRGSPGSIENYSPSISCITSSPYKKKAVKQSQRK